MNTEKRVDLTDIPTFSNITVVPWHGKTLHVRSLIEPQETIEIVNDVMAVCYNKNDDTIVPEMRDFAFRVCVITKYADVLLPEDLMEKYKFVYLTNLYDVIEKRACSAQIEMMKSTIEHMMFRSAE